jgi:alanine racemase
LTVSSSGVRPLAARIDLGAVRHNIRFLKGLLPAGCGVMAVVKANAYGHGDVQVARAALQAGATCLGVALVEEGRRLREASFDCDIYLLFEPPPRGASDALEQDLVCSERRRGGRESSEGPCEDRHRNAQGGCRCR